MATPLLRPHDVPRAVKENRGQGRVDDVGGGSEGIAVIRCGVDVVCRVLVLMSVVVSSPICPSSRRGIAGFGRYSGGDGYWQGCCFDEMVLMSACQVRCQFVVRFLPPALANQSQPMTRFWG